jgi:aspartyl-tRNA(Asn)/glutamyl-tRNA(Gln) amidotransferase subunit C
LSSTLDEATVRHVATLARLNLTPQELSRLTHDLSAVLGYMEQLNELDTDDVTPTAHAAAVLNVMRDDQPVFSPAAHGALANAPHRQDGFFRVPKVLDQGGGA